MPFLSKTGQAYIYLGTKIRLTYTWFKITGRNINITGIYPIISLWE